MHPNAHKPLHLFAAAFSAAILSAASFAATGPAGPDRSEQVDLSTYRSVLYVDQAHGDDVTGKGSSEQPFASLPRAMEAAGRPAARERVAILVSRGTYVQPTFVLKSRVDLYGGFSSPGGARDVYANPSVLDGREDERIAFGADDSRIDGFHFVNARVRGKGAAILCDGTSPVVANSVFTNNRTLIPEPWAPEQLHETANDGGAIMCVNGAAPSIEHNLFYANSTECGRGAAIASDHGAAPRITRNVFANNRSGLDDPMRSSDGGAVTFFRWSKGEFIGNVVVANESLTRNDAGGLWIALWSSPRVADNVFVANDGGDDAGALFIGGQEHRYGVQLDPYPPADKFNVDVERNVFVGNSNSSRNSGAMRVTMESRARFANNIIADNAGGFYLQRSEITAEHNTVWQDWRFLEDKASLGPSRFEGNVLKGPAGAIEARVTLKGNMASEGVPGSDRTDVADIFLDDGVDGELADLHFDPATCTTVFTTKRPLPSGVNLSRRPVNFGDNPEKPGQWRVIARASGNQFAVWGRIDPVTKVPKYFHVLRTFTPKPDAPAGLGARVN